MRECFELLFCQKKKKSFFSITRLSASSSYLDYISKIRHIVLEVLLRLNRVVHISKWVRGINWNFAALDLRFDN